MILRKIQKKIRQIEPRTNRIVQSSSPVFQLLGITTRVEDRQYHDSFGFDQKVNRKGKAANDNCAPNFTPHFWKPFGIVRDTLKVLLDGGAKFLSQAFALLFVISNGTIKLLFGQSTKDKAALHLRYFASSLALTSSNETTSSGLAIWSCRRRSINSASPGVSSRDSTIPSQRLRQSSICSASGSARASFRTISELMAIIYADEWNVQLKIQSPAFSFSP